VCWIIITSFPSFIVLFDKELCRLFNEQVTSIKKWHHQSDKNTIYDREWIDERIDTRVIINKCMRAKQDYCR